MNLLQVIANLRHQQFLHFMQRPNRILPQYLTHRKRSFDCDEKDHCPVKDCRWFEPCDGAPCCPKHNPPIELCMEPEIQELNPPKCIFEREYRTRNHGRHCPCKTCKKCRENDAFQCSLSEMHGPDCTCHLCLEPHDHGCKCYECEKAASSKKVIEMLKQNLCLCKQCCNERKDDNARIQKLGPRCYCLLQHKKDCNCKDCVKCRKDLKRDKLMDKLRFFRDRKFFKILQKLEKKHGKNCDCLKCVALRQRIDISYCNEHLESCRCWIEQGECCKCKQCWLALRKRKFTQIPKAEDYW